VRRPERSPGGLGALLDPTNHAQTRAQHDGSRAFNQVNFERGGYCQLCEEAVPSEYHGLQCCHRGHWIDWGCIAEHMNWDQLVFEAG
jgi:hypothetical protein